jgi:RNA polymerase sigma factor (sigma-70 family)
MSESDFLAEQFEEHRSHLRAVAYRMLGSLTEADDAVQEGWLRLSRSDSSEVENLRAWLTTVVARVCLNVLRSRRTRGEVPLDVHVPDPIVSAADGTQPEDEALLADSVGLALLVVLETLTPAERLAFVLHDMFAVPFEQIADLVERSPEATRQLASRARRRVQGQAPVPDADLAVQRRVVEAFFAAARDGDFEGLVAVLDPDVVSRSDGGALRPEATAIVRGAREVASRAISFARLAPFVRPALVNGGAGVVVAPPGETFAVMGFTVAGGRIVEIDSITDPARLRELDLTVLDG